MQFVPNIEKDNLVSLEIRRSTHSITFNLPAANGKRSWANLPALFNATNHLISNLSEDDKENLFIIYENIHHLTTHKREVDDFGALTEDLTSYIIQIFDLIPLEGIMAWCTGGYPDFAVPDTITDTVLAGNYPPSSSYNRHEYYELCGLSTIFKLLLPITFGFSNVFKSVFENDFKEYYMMYMFTEAGVASVPPFEKLITQARDKLSNAAGEIDVPMGLLTESIGVENYPLFIVSPDIMRTLCLSETDVAYHKEDTANNIAAKLSNAIANRIKAVNDKFQYNDVPLPRDNAKGDVGNTSNQEAGAAIQKFSDLYGQYFNKMFTVDNLPERLKVDPVTYEKFHKLAINNKVHIDTLKMVVCALVFPKYAYVETSTLIRNLAFRNFLAGAATKCHELGLYSIADYLMTMEDVDSTAEQYDKHLATKTRLSRQLLEKASLAYEETVGGHEQIVEYLDALVSKICDLNYLKSSPKELHESYGLHVPFVLDTEFKADIARLICITEGIEL